MAKKARRQATAKRKATKSRVEKPYNNGTWSRARFMSFIRSNLRLMSRKWGPIQAALRNARRPYAGSNRRQKWEYQCSVCDCWHSAKDVQVEHTIPCGGFTCLEDAGRFLERMLVEVDGLSVMCKECHQKKTNKERKKRATTKTKTVQLPERDV